MNSPLLQHINENIEAIEEFFSRDKLKGRIDNPDTVDMTNIDNLKHGKEKVDVEFDKSLDSDKKREHRMITAGPIIKQLFSKKFRIKLLSDPSVYKEYINMTDWLIDTDGRQMTHPEFIKYSDISLSYITIDNKYISLDVYINENPIHVKGAIESFIDSRSKLTLNVEHLGN